MNRFKQLLEAIDGNFFAFLILCILLGGLGNWTVEMAKASHWAMLSLILFALGFLASTAIWKGKDIRDYFRKKQNHIDDTNS